MNLGLLACLKTLNINNTLPAPILLTSYNGHPTVLDGVKRVPDGAADNSNNFYYLTNFTLEKDEDQIKYWIELNLKHRQISDAEFILLLKNTRLYLLFNNYLTKQQIDEYKKCFNFEHNILKYLAVTNIPKNLIKYLYTASDEIRLSVNNILKNYNINPSNLKNLIEYSNDIFIKTETNILESSNFLKLLSNSGINTAFDFINKTRFEKHSLKKNKILKIQNLIKSKTLRTSFDNSFEKNGIILNILLEKEADVNNLGSEILENLNNLKEILKIYNE